MRSLICVMALLWPLVSVHAAPQPVVTTCTSCSECSTKMASGDYDVVELTVDLVDQPGICIVPLNANDVELDCQGHLVDGDDIAIDPDHGVGVIHGANVVIRNCRVSGFTHGIYLWDVAGAEVEDTEAWDNGVGLYLGFATSVQVNGNTFDENFTGLAVENSSSQVSVVHNQICGNSTQDIRVTTTGSVTGACTVTDETGTWDGSPGGTPISDYPCGHIFSHGWEFQVECWLWSSEVTKSTNPDEAGLFGRFRR